MAEHARLMRRLAGGPQGECTIGCLPASEARRQTAATLLEQRPRTILVLGGGDAGKSSYCRLRSFCAPESGSPSSTRMSGRNRGSAGDRLSPMRKARPSNGLQAEAFYFMASTGPVGRMPPLVVGTAHP